MVTSLSFVILWAYKAKQKIKPWMARAHKDNDLGLLWSEEVVAILGFIMGYLLLMGHGRFKGIGFGTSV